MRKFILMVFFLPVLASAQVTFNVKQDFKLAFIGDDHGNEPWTTDITFTSEWRGNQQADKYLFGAINVGGYMFVGPEFEYADLKGGIYRRYSANVGWTFNRFFSETQPVGFFDPSKITATSSLSYGIINYNGTELGFGANFQLGYNFGPVEFYLDYEIVDRKDLQYYTSKKLELKDRLRGSGKFGIKIPLTKK